MLFEEEYTERRIYADRVIRSFLPEAEGPQKTLLESMRYSMLLPGKRIRPVMLHAAYELAGGKNEDDAPFLAAIEMIHTASLIHDDLPALDNDGLRRGKPTNHVVFGEAMAILAGDGLQNYAYETAAKALQGNQRESAVRAFSVFAEKCGISGMLAGQSVDVELDGQMLSEDVLQFIYARKTAALLEGALMTGAALAGADEDMLRALENIGRLVGLAFQIRDDILDVTGNEDTLGKPIGSDARNEKTTFVTLHGLADAQRKVEELTWEALRAFDLLMSPHPFLRQMLLWLCGRTY